MERSFITVKPDPGGWMLVAPNARALRYRDQGEALQAAARMTHALHAVRGRPFGVELQMACGDRVLVAREG
ncbi:MAG: hypothetical protein HOQ02_08845 [Lysobacter sp.]|nr:hypothetical protein [Lysobacter sp.]